MSEERFARTNTFPMRRYVLEPGDGTRYDFSITACSEHNSTLTGVGDGKDFVTLTIYSTLGCGSYEVRRDALRHPESHFIGYLRSHSFCMVPEYTIAAVLLAASVLIDKPLSLNDAMDEMLKAKELLDG